MAGILDQVLIMLRLYLQGLHLAIISALPVRGRDPELSGTVSASHDHDQEQEQAGPRKMLMEPRRDPLPHVGTLARVWADEQAAQQADQMARDLLSRPLSIDDVRTAGPDERDGWPMLLGGGLFSEADDADGLRLHRLWSETVVCDDASRRW